MQAKFVGVEPPVGNGRSRREIGRWWWDDGTSVLSGIVVPRILVVVSSGLGEGDEVLLFGLLPDNDGGG
jgi:hypothetical protein